MQQRLGMASGDVGGFPWFNSLAITSRHRSHGWAHARLQLVRQLAGMPAQPFTSEHVYFCTHVRRT